MKKNELFERYEQPNDLLNGIIWALIITGFIVVAVLGLYWGVAHATEPGNNPCRNPQLPANEQQLEVIGNTQFGVAYNVAGILTLQDTRPETTISQTYNKHGKLLTSTVNLAPKAHLTLTITGSSGVGGPPVVHEYTIDAGSSIALPWATVENNAFFSVTLESDQPLDCTGSDLTVDAVDPSRE